MVFCSRSLADRCKIGACIIDNFDQILFSFLVLVAVLLFVLFLSIFVIIKQYNYMKQVRCIGDMQARLNRITTTLSTRNVMNERNIANERELQNVRLMRALEHIRE